MSATFRSKHKPELCTNKSANNVDLYVSKLYIRFVCFHFYCAFDLLLKRKKMKGTT